MAIAEAGQIKHEAREYGKQAFESALNQFDKAATHFEGFEVKTTKKANEVHKAIFDALNLKTVFRITGDTSPLPETFVIEALQEFSTILGTSAGRRNVVVVVSQRQDDETQVLYKVIEYKSEAVYKLSIGSILGTPGSVNYVAIHPSLLGPLTPKLQARITEGVSNVTTIVQGAIGQTTPPSSPQ